MLATATALAGVCAALAALAPPAQAALSFLHAAPAGGPAGVSQIADQGGREVLLKGVNVDGLVDYFRSDLKAPYPTSPSAYARGACPPDDPTV
jgi:hypothetical protein